MFIKNVRTNCGIAGLYNSNNINNKLLKKSYMENMLEKTTHRGTDNTSFNVYKNSIIGINRLSIVDLESGNQPLHNLQNNVHLVGNGFIYNYESIMDDLKNSGYNFKTHNDFQVVPYLYDKYGYNFIDHIEGMFSILLFDETNNIFIAARDPIGKKPLYYLNNPETQDWFFSSECKSFLNIDQDLKNVNEIDAGTVMIHDGNRKNINKYYNIPKMKQIACKNKVRNLLDFSVKKRMRADVEVGTFLSGGLDSSIITALGHKYNKNIKAITVGMKDSPDLINAKLVAEHLNIEHIVCDFTTDDVMKILPKVIYHLESYNPSAVNCTAINYLTAKTAKENGITVVLCGEGADELFGGYLVLRDKDTYDFIESSWNMIENIYKTECKRLDRSTMAVTIEARCPFLDRNLIEYAMNLPVSSKLKKTEDRVVEKYILREAFEDMLPSEVVWREKEPFDQGSGGRGIIDVINNLVDDKEVEQLKKLYPHANIQSKEMAYYYKIFRNYFGDIGGDKQFELFGDYPVMQQNIVKRTSKSGS
jgi:asparagine synthase (glutamine-hydrolysing)